MLMLQKANGGLNQGAKGSRVTGTGREPVKDERPTLADAGIDKKLSSRAQKLAAVPEEKFKADIGAWRERAETDDKPVTSTIAHVGHNSGDNEA